MMRGRDAPADRAVADEPAVAPRVTHSQLHSLSGRTALVTGGAGRYGRAICRVLSEAGAHVVVTSRRHDAADTFAAELRDSGYSASGAELDLADPQSIDTLPSRVSGWDGGVDVLVNNAVHRQGGDLWNTTADDWTATSSVNSRGLFLLTELVVSALVSSGRTGTIINIGSIYGITGPDFSLYQGTSMTTPAFYAFDKAGMIGATRYLARQLGPHGIRVNCLAPGGLIDGTQPDSFVRRYSEKTPLGRMAVESDIAGPLLLLASDAGAYITGITLPVDGGFTA